MLVGLLASLARHYGCGGCMISNLLSLCIAMPDRRLFRWTGSMALLAWLVIAGPADAQQTDLQMRLLPEADLTAAAENALMRRLPRAQAASVEQVDAPSGKTGKSGKEGGEFRLAEAEGLALANNPALSAAAARLAAAQGKWLQAGLPPNIVFGYMANEMGADGSAGQQGAFLSQRFITGGKLRLDRQVAGQEIRQAEARVQAQRYRVLTDVRVRFYQTLLAQRRVEMGHRLVEVGTIAAETTELLWKAKEGRRVDFLQARIELERARIALGQYKNSYRYNWQKLAAAMGVPRMALQSLADDLKSAAPNFTWSAYLDRLLTASPQMLAAAAELDRARWAVARAQAEVIPDLQTQVAVQKDDATGDTLTSVQAGVAVPLWNRNQGNIRRARAEIALAQQNLHRTSLRLREQAAEAFREYENAMLQADQFSQRILPDAQTTIDLVEAGFRAGEVSYLDLLTVQRTYFQANLDYLQAVEQLWIAAGRLQGLLLDGSLNTPIPPR